MKLGLHTLGRFLTEHPSAVLEGLDMPNLKKGIQTMTFEILFISRKQSAFRSCFLNPLSVKLGLTILFKTLIKFSHQVALGVVLLFPNLNIIL